MATQEATFGGGCFWCTEAVMRRVRGVTEVVSGYAGGHVDDPGYEAVCTGSTGHAEVVRVSFDPDVIGYADLVRIFMVTHDPTTRNRQGNDVGPQYRSVIFTHDDVQAEIARSVISQMQAEHLWGAPVVTDIEPLTNWFPAEAYHQRYFENNPRQGYCAAVIAPKVAKLRKEFADRMLG